MATISLTVVLYAQGIYYYVIMHKRSNAQFQSIDRWQTSMPRMGSWSMAAAGAGDEGLASDGKSQVAVELAADLAL